MLVRKLARSKRRTTAIAFSSPLFISYLSSFSSSSSSTCGVRRRRVASASFHECPPTPKKVPFVVSAHGSSWVDPYHWMSNKADPDLSRHLHLENSYAHTFMADAEGLRSRLLGEMKAKMPPKVSAPPERWGPWLYYQYIPEEKEYPVLCRKWRGYGNLAESLLSFVQPSPKEEVLLNWNEIAEHYGYVHIGTCKVSPDHRFLAYTVDTSGDENFILQVKDLKNGSYLISSGVEGVVNVAWSKDSTYLLYTISDETLRPFRVYSKRLLSGTEGDFLFEEKDASCCVDIASTKDGKFIAINSNSRSSSEVYVMDAEFIHQKEMHLVRRRKSGVQYFLEHHNGYFYILTNASESIGQDAGRYHIARCRAEKSELAKWEDIILAGSSDTFQDMDVFNGHLVLFLQKEGLATLCSINMPLTSKTKHAFRSFNVQLFYSTWWSFFEGAQPLIVKFTKGPFKIEDLDPWIFPMPSNICSLSPGSNHDFMSTTYRVIISSPVMPDIIVDYNIMEKSYKVVHQEVSNANIHDTSHHHVSESASRNLGNSELNVDVRDLSDLPGKFICERKEVISHDGVSVPVTIVCSTNAGQSSQSPALLHGYGAYGESLDKSWCPERICLLERGWTLAFADVRGGCGGGNSWHQDGTGLNKLNSVYDFVACARYLISEGYAHQNRLCAMGFSAGGLLVGATINMYPQLFSAAILKVPFLDICNTLLDPSLPLTMMDYEEFGNPRIESDFRMLRSYSPYDNISPGICPPPMLVTAAFNDSRVGVWEAAKWVARWRDNCFSCSRSIILKTNMDAGHFGEGGRFQQCEESAFEYAFLIKVIAALDET